jgi:hypothetical protein
MRPAVSSAVRDAVSNHQPASPESHSRSAAHGVVAALDVSDGQVLLDLVSLHAEARRNPDMLDEVRRVLVTARAPGENIGSR